MNPSKHIKIVLVAVLVLLSGCDEPPGAEKARRELAERETKRLFETLGMPHGGAVCHTSYGPWHFDCEVVSDKQVIRAECGPEENGLHCNLKAPEPCQSGGSGGPHVGVTVDSKGRLNPTVLF